jgi:hypothetical protein
MHLPENTIIFAGWTSSPLQARLARLPVPKAPKNYSSKDAIQGYIARELTHREERSARVPFLARLTGLCLLDLAGNVRFNQTVPSTALSDHLAKALLDILPVTREHGWATIYAFDAERLHVMLVAGLMDTRMLDYKSAQKLDNALWCDPYEDCIPEEERATIPAITLCNLLDIGPKDANAWRDPLVPAQAARQLAIASGEVEWPLPPS